MPNGSGLLGGASGCQAVLAIPNPGNSDQYYIFTVGSPGMFGPIIGLHFSILDMQLNGGLGDIVPGMKNLPLLYGDSAVNQISATRHQNNKDVWVLVLRHGITKQYLAYLVNNLGIATTPVMSNSELQQPVRSPSYNLKISQDGNNLICSDAIFAEICYFNKSTGIVTSRFTFNPQIPGINYVCRGKEFSINSSYLYISVNGTLPDNTPLFQYDITKPDSASFMQSQLFIGYGAGVNIQMGPDWKIYLNNYDPFSDSLNRINNPSIQGLACNYDQNAFSLEGNDHAFGLPQFLQKYKTYIHTFGNCQNSQIHFSGDIWPPADSIYWNFGDPTSGMSNYSNDSTPSHIYAFPGQYTVELFVRYIDNRTDTSWMTITIHESPSPSLGPDQTICQGDLITFDAGFCSSCTYEWTSIPPGYSSTLQTVTLNQTGLYTVSVTTTNGCTGRDTIQLNVTPPPLVTNNPLSKSICSGESTNIPLTSNVPNTTFSWTAIGSSPLVTGFSPGSGDTIDQALANSGSGPGTVSYWITPAVGNCVGDSVQFVVTVTPGDSVNISISASADFVCEGTPITFNATTTYGGSSPAFQWKVNGLNQETNDSVFTYAPVNGDTVTCVLTSSTTICITNNPVTSNAIVIIVYPNLPVNISIIASVNPVCEGNPATYTASTSNKGTLPNFQWFVNGNPSGSNDSIFTYIPTNGDQVYCVLTSSEQCTTNNPVISDTIIMMVNPILPVDISISASANPVCEGLPVTFTATPINGGTMPEYQWQVNGINTGTNNSDFTYTPVNGDIVTCSLTSNAECITNNPATSNSITMSVGEAPDVSFTVCFDTITTLDAKPFKLKGGVPLGGTYSGPGVDQITGYFNLALAGVGVKTISYSYTNLFNCSNNAARAISVINPAPFSCGDSLTDIRDNKKYPTVQIGNQCWLAGNMNHGQQIGASSAQRDNCLVEKYCYNDLPANCTQYGALYQWDELMRYEEAEEDQGLCPPGWHVPSETDWNQLFAVYQGNAFAGSPLLYTGYSGFNVLLAGVEFFNQSHRFADFASIMWSSTAHGSFKAWSHGLNEYNYSVSYYPSYRSNAFSVRCVRD